MKYISTDTNKTFEPRGLLEIENFLYVNPEKPIFGPMSVKIHARLNGKQTSVYLCQDGFQEGVDWDWHFSRRDSFGRSGDTSMADGAQDVEGVFRKRVRHLATSNKRSSFWRNNNKRAEVEDSQ